MIFICNWISRENNNNSAKEGGDAGEKDDGVGGAGTSPSSQYFGGEEPAVRLRRYEEKVSELSMEFEDGMVRF